MKIAKQQRIILAVLSIPTIGGMAVYQTIQRNDLDYQTHPVAAILGSIFPAIILAPVLYWRLGRIGRDKRNKKSN